MKNPKMIVAVLAVILALCVVALLVYWVTKEPLEEPDESPLLETEQPTEDTPDTAPTTTPETEPISRPVIDLDEGNEVYLDASVVEVLTNMESEGEEDLVNAILDGEITLINHFVKAGYSKKAICQIQRFYYDFYDQLKAEPMENVIENLTACIPTEGAIFDGFADRVQAVWGWGGEWIFDYVIDGEVEV